MLHGYYKLAECRKERECRVIYVIMCAGKYDKWQTPKHLTPIKGEPIVARTIRLLRECGAENIAISTNQPGFDGFGVEVIHNETTYRLGLEHGYGAWLDAFVKTDEPTCYLFGDVVFSKEAIRTIVTTETDSVEFFASAPPFGEHYIKPWAEPFAYKVVDTKLFFDSIERAKRYDEEGCFYRMAVSWELWQVIKRTPLNRIDYTNYTVINDWTCDIDDQDDIKKIEVWVNG